MLTQTTDRHPITNSDREAAALLAASLLAEQPTIASLRVLLDLLDDALIERVVAAPPATVDAHGTSRKLTRGFAGLRAS